MANVILTAKNAPGIISKLVAAHIAEGAKFIGSIEKEDSSIFRDQYKAASAGDTVQVKIPTQFTVGSNLDITSTIQDVKEQKVSLTLDKTAVVAFKMNSLETCYDKPVSYWYKEYGAPALNAMTAEMERWALDKAVKATANLVGTAGTQSGSTQDMLDAGQRLYEMGAPEGSTVYGMLSPATNNAAVQGRKGLFNSAAAIGKQYKTGVIDEADGIQFMRSNLLPSITNGADVTGIAVESTVLAPATGATTLGVDGVTSAATITAGTKFTIAGVYAVHPLTKVAYPWLKEFTVTADVTETAGNSVIMSISPAIYSSASGSLQNVSALPADEAALVFFGSASTAYRNSLIYVPEAFRFVSVPLYKPDGVEFAENFNHEGVAVSVCRFFDGRTRENIMRFDMLAALAAVRPEWACRLAGLN